MKTIFFIRHAKSSWADPELADIDRPLNKRGLRDAPFMAKLLRAKHEKVDHIISSPANRAFTTCSYFAKEFAYSTKNIDVKKEIYHAFMEDVFDIIKKVENKHQSVAVFGHNPTFTSIANHFNTEYIPNVPTCGIVVIESSAKHWQDISNQNAELKAFYYPKQYFE